MALPLALQAAAAGVQAVGAISGGYAKAAGMKTQASAADHNAIMAHQASALDADQVLRQGRAAIGSQSAAAAQNGLGFTGSVTDSLAASAANVQMDADNAIYGGRLKGVNYANQASALRSEAGNAVSAGWLGGASALLSSAGAAYKGTGG
jgi:hypothetical protein